MSHTKGKWEKVICVTEELKPLNTKARYLEFCEGCWDLTQKHGAQKDFFGVRRAGKNKEETVIIALCGNGPDGSANARLIAAAPDLLEACKCALWSIKQRLICGKGEDPEMERDMIMALIEAAIAKYKKEG